jgi:hypothetical protein
VTKIPLAKQIDEMFTVIGLTGEAVKSGELSPDDASKRFPRLHAILGTLKWLQTHEARIKAMLKETKE